MVTRTSALRHTVSAALVASLVPLLAHCTPDLNELRSGGSCPDDSNPACPPVTGDDGAAGGAGDTGEVPQEASTEEAQADGGPDADLPVGETDGATGDEEDASLVVDASQADEPMTSLDTGTLEAGPDGGGFDASDGADAGCALSVPGLVLCSFPDVSLGCSGLPGALWERYEEFGPPSGDAQPPPPSMIDWSKTEGRACPGALSLTVPFTSYTSPNRVMVLTNIRQNWTGKTKLHAWAKIVAPTASSLGHISGVQLSVQSSNYTAFRGFFVNATVFADGQWHEMVGSLAPTPLNQPAPFVPADVVQIGVQLVGQNAPPAGGPPSPVPTTIYVDDIWLE